MKPSKEAPAAVPAARQAFYDRIDPLHLAPLWEVFSELITPEPRTPCVPHLWSWRAVRPFLMESGGLISAREAERRVLILENPALRGQASITRSLYAGLQLVLPGEIAPCHRHAQSALRLIVEGAGAYTAVDGERSFMERGDFIVTGPWGWHDHGNDTTDPVVWLDGLDIPLVRFLDASFLERHPQEIHPETRPPGDNTARFGANLLPVGYRAPAGRSPLFSYPYACTREALERMRRWEEWDPHHGLKMAFINPLDGGPAMSTLSTFIQLLPGISPPRPTTPPTARWSRSSRGAGRPRWAGTRSPGSPATPSWCPPGIPTATRRWRRPCCSAFRTGSCRKNWACGASNGGSTASTDGNRR